ncbi:PAS domain S-box protein [Caulobacter sp. DWR3-1-2]|uniref:hybrid sensor histidine kinase/response regulator n=1 Tax=Caulobacter sp. DWR3-1-2 TaxID=2804647 RepID=UPI003CEF1E71
MDPQSHNIASQDDDGRYKLLVDAITDYAVYMLDRDGRVSSWNPGPERFKGYQPHEVIGQHFSQFYTPEDREAGVPARALHQAATEGRFEQEGWRLRKDGGRFWAHVVIDPIRLPSGEVVGFAKITRDQTERKAVDEALRGSEAQFKLLVEGVTDYALYMLDPDGQVASWNAGAARITGYAANEIIGHHFSRFYTEEDRLAEGPELALRTAVADGRFEKEGWRLRKDGSRFWAHVVIDAIRDDRGRVIGFAKSTRDITERRNTQRALDHAREALFQSQKLEAIGQLTGGLAHDFNNLLMAVLGSLELVRKRLPVDPRITPLIDNAIQGAERGAALTQRMLAFARKQELQLRAVDIATLVQGMTGLLQRSIGPSIHLQTQFPDDLAWAFTDANQLENALLNLVVNARNAMPTGGLVRIEATNERIDQQVLAGLAPGGYVRLTVTDTGEGMDAKTASRATEPFYTTKGIGKGSGLGLSMVYGLVEESGGRLILHSQLGEGTSLELWLRQASPEDQQRVVTDNLEALHRDEIGSLVVLAVDDDELVLMNTSAMLEELGHRVLKASSGEEALATLQREAVDLVITDFAMPHMTGIQLAEAMRARNAHIPVLLTTGYAELQPGAGANLPRLAKPFGQDDLERAVRQAAGSTGRRAAE